VALNLADRSGGQLIRETKSLCPECGGIIPARIFEREGRVIQVKQCPAHGGFEFVIHDDPAFFKKCLSETSGVPREFHECDIQGCLGCERHLGHIKTIMIDVTERCDLNCPACFTNTHSRKSREPSADEIVSRLKKLKDKPTILICGGEPTLRTDLAEIIRKIVSLGFVVKVATNGIKLADESYARSLRDAGLGWALLQFDGFSDDIYRVTRGRELLETKRRALASLEKAGIKVCLACMAAKGVNDGEIGKIVDFMMGNDNIMHLGCTVLSSVGRDNFGAEQATTALDVMKAVEAGTRGRIVVKDFMRSRAIGNFVFRLTGNRDFQQKSCFHMLLLYKRGKDYIPVNRYFDPAGAVANAGGLAKLAALFGSLRHWDAIQMTGEVKLFTIEEFRARDTIDLTEANCCNKVYMSDEGYIPPCIYNTKYREMSWLPKGDTKDARTPRGAETE